ncbi:MAG: TetR/AcrR family transcriptional regulator [Burkholderiaceae bacterium]|nr:TetR/AcrR family transcriptional regulator [Burkholderiaceae bacterium]
MTTMLPPPEFPIQDRAERKEADRERVRQSILDAAGQMLLEEGPHALSMRRLAERIQASTIVLYTHFRDKPAIVDALFRDGFERLRADLEAVPLAAEPMERVLALGRAYRQSALANAARYQVMFTRCVPGFEPSAESLAVSQRCFEILRDAVQAVFDAGHPLADSVAHTTQVLWGTLHGLISLELFGYLGSTGSGEQRLEQAMQLLRAGIPSVSTSRKKP